MLRTPPAAVTRKRLLATDGAWSHTICMPGISHAQIDAFITDLHTTTRRDTQGLIPAQRRRT